MNEFALIDACFKRLGDATGALLSERYPELNPSLAIGDDCAVINVPAGQQLVVSTDTLVAGVHFPAGTRAYDVGYKALAVNLSDLAAMGATPAWFTLCVTLPEMQPEWVDEFCNGMAAVLTPSPIALVGGDTTRGPLSISIQVMGVLPAAKALTRSGACPGDDIYVSGYLGEAARGLALALDSDAEERTLTASEQHCLCRLNRPTPRVELGQRLRELAHACIDVSDGLLADLNHILRASGVGAQLDIAQLPVPEGVSLEQALSGGDDYELCFTASTAVRDALQILSSELGLPVSRIGRVIEQAGLYDQNQNPLTVAGYQHFQ